MDNSGSIEGALSEERLTGVNWLTRVNQVSRCVRKVERTRTVGFKLPEPLVEAYAELPSSSKTLVKTVTMSMIYALARKHGVEVECEEQLKPMLSEVPSTGGSIIINANIAEAKQQVNVNIDLESIVDLVKELYKLRRGMPQVQRRLVEELYERVKHMN